MKKTLLFIILSLTLSACGIYSFTGGNVGDAKTIQIDIFRNEAPLIEPTLSAKFTEDLRDLFTRQTNLTLVKNNGDLQFEGEVVGYRITPVGSNAKQTAPQNRLTITINVRYTNKLTEEDNFEREFSHYNDFGANENPQGAALEDMFNNILERINQDIFTASVAKW